MLAGLLLGVTGVVTPPNIVYIMADDLGYGEVGCFGQEKIPTPHIDRLAQEGMRLTRSYSASPVCAPTRYSLLTGKHQGNAAIRGNKERGGFGPNDPEGQTPLAESEITIAELLKKRGYRTGLVGKWGLGSPEPKEHPLNHGFDSFYGYLCQRRAHSFYPAALWRNHEVDLLDNPVYPAHQKIAEPLASDQEYEQRFGGKTYSAERLAQECEKFIQTGKKGEPFFLYYAPTLPHVALQAPKEWVDRFPREWDTKHYLGQNGYLPNARPNATYAAMIAFLDDTVGRVRRALEKAGVAQNTLIIFTSDNGATHVGGVDRAFFRSNGSLRAGKMSLYEGGVRVPTVAWWPGRVAPGTESAEPVICYDALATLCEAAGVKAPKTDGRSYLPVLLGQTVKPRPWIYSEYPEASIMQAVWMGNFKAVRPNLKQDQKLELYDLSNDPGETRDLAAQRPDLVKRAQTIMAREHRPNALFPLGLVDQKQP